MKKILLISIFAFIVGTGTGLYLLQDAGERLSPLAEMGVGGDFTLYAGDRPVQLSDYKGKVVMLFFGYTSCPDICPMTLASVGSALKKLTDKERVNVQALFISVDPERDTPDKIRRFTRYFHTSMLGLSGSKQDIDKVAKQYASAYRKVETDSEIGYLVDHSSAIYLVNRQGLLAELLPGNSEVDIMVSKLKDLM